MNPYLLVALGGALGSIARYGSGVLVGRVLANGFPLATLLINIAGSLGMGLFVGYLAKTTPGWEADARLFVAAGVFGGFTTFSAFSLDAVQLIERGQIWQALAYVVVSVLAAIGALYFGLMLMRGGA